MPSGLTLSRYASIESSIGNVEKENSPTTGSFPSLHPFRKTGLNKILTAGLMSIQMHHCDFFVEVVVKNTVVDDHTVTSSRSMFRLA